MAEDFLTEAYITLRNRSKAEDALQEAFCRLWGRKYRAASLKEAVGLLSRTRRNIKIDEYRRQGSRKTVSLEEVRSAERLEIAEEPDEGREELFSKVEASVEKELTDIQKRIVRMHEYEGMTFERIARELGMQPAAVRMAVSRARKVLREKFREDEKD